MGIKKHDLKDFIMGKVEQRREDTYKYVREKIKAAFRPVIYRKFSGVSDVELRAEELHAALTQIIEKHEQHVGWSFKRTVVDIDRYVIGFRDDIVDREAGYATCNLLREGTNALMEELQPLMGQLKEELAPKIKDYKDLIKLKKEIAAVIDTSHNGDKAYKRLLELGVDLSEFKAASSNLPAVIKLSVNPCVLNGDC
ncbi:hypothetical protein KMC73_gp66 [Paenibacillus phage Wanderer]|uniref:Uncharacterized protein n=2 Tax=Wanderervirus wanderer TaxID=2845749 RepID=A0A345ARM9_9CAUD|nr:hypothetical protein KMC73_gp66 [Paenibacillus phage Wanderer]AXF39483.1 hypothetical protein WANDERER_66 [Paenibacillus phage Wanderer]AXF40364.1 hypothetical protein LINCOLNB_66 [Paenibacillus phage LincolnB]